MKNSFFGEENTTSSSVHHLSVVQCLLAFEVQQLNWLGGSKRAVSLLQKCLKEPSDQVELQIVSH